MSKISKKSVKEGIKIAVSAIEQKGIDAEIKLLRIPEDDKVEKGEFAKIATFEGFIKFKDFNTKFEFFTPIPLADHRDSENWSWVIACDFLGRAVFELFKEKGLTDDVKKLDKIKLAVVDELHP